MTVWSCARSWPAAQSPQRPACVHAGEVIMPTNIPEPIDRRAVKDAEKQLLTPRNEKRMRALLDALCDPARITIVRALRDTTLAASDLAHVIGRNRTVTSQHLRVLREHGAIVGKRHGKSCATRSRRTCLDRSSRRLHPSSTSCSQGPHARPRSHTATGGGPVPKRAAISSRRPSRRVARSSRPGSRDRRRRRGLRLSGQQVERSTERCR